MLVITRRPDESFIIDFSQCPAHLLANELGRIKVMLVDTRAGRRGGRIARLGIDAPAEVQVHREEVMDRIDKRPALTPEQRQATIDAIRKHWMGGGEQTT